MRLKDNLEFFENIKQNKEEDAQVLIVYHWRKKLAKIRENERLNALKPPKEEIKKVQSRIKTYIDDKSHQNAKPNSRTSLDYSKLSNKSSQMVTRKPPRISIVK